MSEPPHSSLPILSPSPCSPCSAVLAFLPVLSQAHSALTPGPLNLQFYLDLNILQPCSPTEIQCIINLLLPTGEIMFNNLFYLIQCIQNTITSTCNQYLKITEYFTFFFFHTKSLKSGVDFILTGHLRSDWVAFPVPALSPRSHLNSNITSPKRPSLITPTKLATLCPGHYPITSVVPSLSLSL